MANNYVDNDLFYAALLERKAEVDKVLVEVNFVDADKVSMLNHDERKALIRKLKKGNNLLPKTSNYIGDVFLKMAENIFYKKNFNRYPFREEMIGDAIVDCIKYIDVFDTSKDNPFAYFTSAISMAFIRRIIKEKKEVYTKSKMLSKSSISIFDIQEHDEDGDFTNAFVEYMNVYNNFDGSFFEPKKKEKTKQYNGATIEEFIDELLAETKDTII